MRSCLIFLICFIALHSIAKEKPAITCEKEASFTAGKKTAYQLKGTSAFFFEAPMSIDADGSPKAYHPDDIGLDALANAKNKKGEWVGVVTNEKGEPLIQTQTDPAPGYYISQTSLQDKNYKTSDPKRYVDAASIPYIVLPPAARKTATAKLGDLAAVFNPKTKKLVYAIFADSGNAQELGEGSIFLGESLGFTVNARNKGISDTLFYVVFPGTGDGAPKTVEQINTLAETAFTTWGGEEQISVCQN